MPEKLRIALDCMGGDFGASVVLTGAELSLKRVPNLEFRAFGDRATLEPLVMRRPKLRRLTQVVHSEIAIRMDQKAAEALRIGRSKSSMALAIDAVKREEADFAISAGNTGALMALAKVKLRTIGNIARPALAGLWPSLKGETVVLDRGASIGADAEHLFNLAIMGGARTTRLRRTLHSSAMACVHRISPHVRDDRERPSSAVRRAELWD